MNWMYWAQRHDGLLAMVRDELAKVNREAPNLTVRALLQLIDAQRAEFEQEFDAHLSAVVRRYGGTGD